jgi:exopolyphosphatase/guanosine-5'-triphosphate,3'-diphosphate pyrophosphatase
MSELTDLRTDVGDTRTVAVESEDAEAVTAAVRDLGLADLPNTSFPRGLKALAGPA